MSMDEPEEQDEGIPAWVMTFADLMSLLMCFFVLLLSFSEMDAQKFKQLSGSMKMAFGVQAQIKADFIPKGTSVVATEFSPGKPEPTLLNEIRQHTIDSSKSTLDIDPGKDKSEAEKDDFKDIEAALAHLRKELGAEIEADKLSVRREGSRIIIQIHEQGSFASGFAIVKQNFLPTLDKISRLCANMSGIVQVTGHTDDVPISTQQFRSNWDLSSSRAVTVAHRMLKNNDLDPRRLVITGLAWTQPIVPNDTAENRATNRRVEISILRSSNDVKTTLEESRQTTDPDDATELPAAENEQTPT
ncbi:MAG: flagellar motor protein MotB [Gammaproteobacteria bacterium]